MTVGLNMTYSTDEVAFSLLTAYLVEGDQEVETLVGRLIDATTSAERKAVLASMVAIAADLTARLGIATSTDPLDQVRDLAALYARIGSQ